MKPKHHNEYRIHVAKKLVPADVWAWLMVALDTPYSTLEVVELLPDSELAVEYADKMRSY